MGKKILVVDDEKLIVKGIRFSLEQEGMEVDCAYDGEDALNHIQNKEYDMILLDLMLPKMNGLEVCQHVREFSDVPIIMLTAKGEDFVGFLLHLDEARLLPCENKLGEKHRNMPLCGGFKFSYSPYDQKTDFCRLPTEEYRSTAGRLPRNPFLWRLCLPKT